MKRIADYLLLLPLLVYVDGTKNILKCYQCAVDDNKLCTDEFLHTCPDNQAYDRCMTRITNRKSDGYLIEKSCALSPCTLRDPKQSEGLGLDNCDRSNEEYECISCCRTDGCNKDEGVTLKPTATAAQLLLQGIVFFFLLRAQLLHRY